MKQQTLTINNNLIATIVVLIMLLYVGLLYGVVSWLELKGYKITKTCDSFSSYEEAKVAMRWYPNLDSDHDGRPCETRFSREAILDTAPQQIFPI